VSEMLRIQSHLDQDRVGNTLGAFILTGPTGYIDGINQEIIQ